MVKAPRSQREAGVGRKKSQGKEKGERLKSWRRWGEKTRAKGRKQRREKKVEGASVICTGLSGTVWLQTLFITCLHKYLDSWTFLEMCTWLMMFLISKVTCEPECCTKQQCECSVHFLFLQKLELHANPCRVAYKHSFMVSWNGDRVCSACLCWLFIYDEALDDAHLPSFLHLSSAELVTSSSLYLVQPNFKHTCWVRAAYITNGDREEASRSLSHEASARASPRAPKDPATTWPSSSFADLFSSGSGTFSEQGWAKAC